MNLGAYAISKNEQSNVQRFCEQTRSFDSVTVLDTGSTDNTVDMLRAQGITVYEYVPEEFDFSAARNRCMSLTPPHTDWLLVLDFNDHYHSVDKLRNQLAATTASAATLNYLSSEDPKYCEHKLRLHRPGMYTWTKAVHEYLVPTTSCVPTHINWDITKHVINKSIKHAFYTEICEREHLRHPQDPHYSWWVLNYYRNIGNLQKLQYYCEHYLAHTPAYGVEFRVYALIYLSECLQQHDWHTAVDTSIHAFSESLVFKNTVPDCTSFAAHRLQTLGISIVDSRILK